MKMDWLMSSRANPNRAGAGIQADQGGGVIGALGTHAFDTRLACGPVQRLQSKTRTATRNALC